jgi:hypothetical protein
MKTNKLLDKLCCPLRWAMCIALISFCSGYSHGQTGNTLGTPITVGSYSSAFRYVNSQNTTNFSNNYQNC